MSKVIERWNVHPNRPWLHGNRPVEPIEFDEKLGSWCAYGFAEVERILGDHETFSAKTAAYAAVQVDEKFQQGDISQMDPPEQTKYRKLIGSAFSPRVIASLEPRIHKITDELLDAVQAAAVLSWWQTLPTRCPSGSSLTSLVWTARTSTCSRAPRSTSSTI